MRQGWSMERRHLSPFVVHGNLFLSTISTSSGALARRMETSGVAIRIIFRENSHSKESSSTNPNKVLNLLCSTLAQIRRRPVMVVVAVPIVPTHGTEI
ncbi:hypothetical protein RRG08_061255 [Elysia crispata]|uniref:Uncharacterized protein n=1 Tax=Elysia crispata TaxID=231223 RepID=A0AAE1DFM0_9GAST|nr:hypothetical protein RRG08_061255 [Elysia crispata]